jgi:hypothetical protein
MRRKLGSLTENVIVDDLLVDLTFHDVPAGLLMEFAQKIVQPYYAGNLNRALKDLIKKAITKQQPLQDHLHLKTEN